MARYAVWNKKDKVITPVGEVLSPEQWVERYPVADVLKTVCSGDTINGAFFGVFDQMVEMYTQMGCDFSECKEDQDFLNTIEAFEDEMNKKSADDTTVSDETRIADALEDLVVLKETESL